MFSCDQCGESFTQKCHLNRHKQSKHAGVKYSCDKCNYQATRKDNLNRHMKNKHRRIDADQADPDLSHLSPEKEKTGGGVGGEHLSPEKEKTGGDVGGEQEKTGGDVGGEQEKTGGDVEPHKFKCPHCSLSLASRGSLYNHIKIKHSTPSFICHQCGETLSRKDYLITHLKKT